uniref:ABC transporter permease n=1 Tax=Acidicaldus sp. TaxID=1872105 RepID=A0A8J4HAY1_9PROT
MGGAWREFGQRAAAMLPAALLATLLVFALLNLVPGDPAVTLAGENASAARISEIRHLTGLDRPLAVQYLVWLNGVLHGDLSRSLLSGMPVAQAIAEKLPLSLFIVVLAMAFALVLGVPLGILAATHPGSIIDGVVSGLAALGVALPNFWLAMILVALFAIDLHWLPATGAVSLRDNPTQALRHAILPAMALAAGGMAEVARQVRGALTVVLRAPFVRTLHAKGLPGAAIVWRHGMRNIAALLLTLLALLFNRTLGATVVIETVFAIPGIGSTMVEAAVGKDFPMVQGVVLVMALLVIVSNLLVDLVISWIDPRGRRSVGP